MTDSECEIDSHGTKRWFNDEGQLHRSDGPAVKVSRGVLTSWWVHGKRHRLDGPAVIWKNGSEEWWVNGKLLSQTQFDQHSLVVFHRLCKGAT
jgi:hypothetical protein